MYQSSADVEPQIDAFVLKPSRVERGSCKIKGVFVVLCKKVSSHGLIHRCSKDLVKSVEVKLAELHSPPQTPGRALGLHGEKRRRCLTCSLPSGRPPSSPRCTRPGPTDVIKETPGSFNSCSSFTVSSSYASPSCSRESQEASGQI